MEILKARENSECSPSCWQSTEAAPHNEWAYPLALLARIPPRWTEMGYSRTGALCSGNTGSPTPVAASASLWDMCVSFTSQLQTDGIHALENDSEGERNSQVNQVLSSRSWKSLKCCLGRVWDLAQKPRQRKRTLAVSWIQVFYVDWCWPLRLPGFYYISPLCPISGDVQVLGFENVLEMASSSVYKGISWDTPIVNHLAKVS